MGEHYDFLKKKGVEAQVRAEFDERYYVETYGGSIDPEVEPFLDFIEVGWKAGRNPSPEFDTSYYLGVNYDVAHAGREPLTHYVRRGRAEGRSPRPDADRQDQGQPGVRWTDEEATRTRERVLARARSNLASLPSDFFERHSRVDVTLLMLSQERLDQTIVAIQSIQENVAIPYRLLVIDNGSSPETQRRLQEMFAADDRITLVMREDNLGCAGGRNFGVERIGTEFTMLVDNDIEVMPGTVEHLLYRMECEPAAGAVTSLVVLPNGKAQLCGATYRGDGDVLVPVLHGSGLEFDGLLDLPDQCEWVPGCSALIRTDLLRRLPFDERMTYYEDNDWALRVASEGADWMFQPVKESLIIHYTNLFQIQPAASVEESRRARLRRVANFALMYEKHGFIHGDAFAFIPELGRHDRPESIEKARQLLALLAELGPDGVAKWWQAGQLNFLFGSADTAVGRTVRGRAGKALRRLRRALARQSP